MENDYRKDILMRMSLMKANFYGRQNVSVPREIQIVREIQGSFLKLKFLPKNLKITFYNDNSKNIS